MAKAEVAPPLWIAPQLAKLVDEAPNRRELGSRDQVRRLPHGGAHRRRPRAATDPVGPRLDGEQIAGVTRRRVEARLLSSPRDASSLVASADRGS
jgi:hypothetical protein